MVQKCQDYFFSWKSTFFTRNKAVFWTIFPVEFALNVSGGANCQTFFLISVRLRCACFCLADPTCLGMKFSGGGLN